MSRVSIVLLALLCGVALSQPPTTEKSMSQCTGSATYMVTSSCEWTSMLHPTDYPPNAGFSPMCGVTHTAEYMMFYDGAIATDGVKYVAEEGDCSFLKDEVDQCADDGYCDADAYFSWLCIPPDEDEDAEEPERSGTCTHSGMITVSQEYPYVSMVSMAVPSPDWFVGVSAVDLCVENEDGEYVWVDKYPMEDPANLYAWDAGTDGGASFEDEDDPLDDPEPMVLLGEMDASNIFFNEEEDMLYPLCQMTMEKM